MVIRKRDAVLNAVYYMTFSNVASLLKKKFNVTNILKNLIYFGTSTK